MDHGLPTEGSRRAPPRIERLTSDAQCWPRARNDRARYGDVLSFIVTGRRHLASATAGDAQSRTSARLQCRDGRPSDTSTSDTLMVFATGAAF